MGALKVKPEGPHKDADRVGLDGLPHVGAVVWPQQAYYGTVDRMTCKPCWRLGIVSGIPSCKSYAQSTDSHPSCEACLCRAESVYNINGVLLGILTTMCCSCCHLLTATYASHPCLAVR